MKYLKLIYWPRILATSVILCCVILACAVRLNGNDFWMQAKIGQIILETHQIPQTLEFPFTEIAENHFNAHEWLVSVGFYSLLSSLGEDNMVFVSVAAGFTLFVSGGLISYLRSSKSYPCALLGGFVAVATENYRHVLRPELPALILFSLVLIVLELYSRKPRLHYAFILGALMVLWSNSHGSFVLGPLVIAAYALGNYLDFVKRNGCQYFKINALTAGYSFLFLVSLVCCFVTPFGLRLLAFVFTFSTESGANIQLTEWLPTFDPRMYHLPGFWIALIVWLVLTFLMLFQWRRMSYVDALLYAMFSFLAYKAIRFPVYLGLVAALIAPRYVPAILLAKKTELKIYIFEIVLAMLAIGFIAIFGNASSTKLYPDNEKFKFSEPMVSILESQSLRGNVLNSMELGAELVYRAYPRLRPALDCRVDSYGFDYSNFIGALFKNDVLLDEFVGRYDVRYILVTHDIFDGFSKTSNWSTGKWKLLFYDSRAVLLKRADIGS